MHENKQDKKVACLITGPCGAGKSSVADELAKMIYRSARIDVDYLRHSVKNGYAPPWEKSNESKRQVSLGTKNACTLAQNFLNNEVSVIIDDVVNTQEKLDDYNRQIPGLKVFVLLPDMKTLGNRDKQRGENAMGKRALDLHEQFETIIGKMDWTVVDSSNQSVRQTAEEIFNLLF